MTKKRLETNYLNPQQKFLDQTACFSLIKVSKSGKQILKLSFEPKNKRKYFRGFQKPGQKYKNIFVRFLVQKKALKFAFEIY